uniref:Putative salivary sulfotransferase n=1 Tax=Amblyomma aureolatum TaxID=187763 RepID=A0A1E1X6R8_9ACAR
MQRRKPKYQIIDGVPRCVSVDPHILRESLKFRARKGDIVQSTFPKSGTHWVQYITQLILREGEPITTHEELSKEWRFLEYMDIKDWKSTLPLRSVSTHLPLSKDTMTEDGKYVYVARNPWDVCVSFYKMASNLSPYEFQDGTFDEFVDVFVNGNFGYGDYFEHVASGYALREEPNVFFITYEELKKDTRQGVLRLAHFLGERFGKALEEDENMLDKLLNQSTPEYMRRVVVINLSENPNPSWQELFSRQKPTCKEGYDGDKNRYAVVRTAKVGGWKEYFTPELLRRMESRIVEAEKSSSFMNLWKDIRSETMQLAFNGC